MLIIFAPEKAEIFKDYLHGLVWFRLDCLYFLMIERQFLFSDVKFAIYFNKNKIGKINICVLITRKQKPCRQKIVSDKQIKIFFWKNVALYEIYSKKSKGRILKSMDCIFGYQIKEQ
jgi:hypothetical protein